MKHTFCNIVAAAFLLLAGTAHAQDAKTPDTDKKEHKKKHEVSISSRGILIHTIDSTIKAEDAKPKKDSKWTGNMSLDLGLNMMQDNTDYTSAAVKNYLQVPGSQQNKALFNIRQSKSVYVNYYPWLRSYRALKTDGQKIYISSGIGFQFYNFKYENNITYTHGPSKIIDDSLKFTKNKLGIDYLNVPLMVTFKTRISHNANPKKDKWLVYGFGVTEGIDIRAWSKQISPELGKVKVHNHFDIADMNTCINAEIGIDDVIRIFGSYQVTSLYNGVTGLDQHPIAFGLRISGI